MNIQLTPGNIAIVLPRGTSFGPLRATSIDLCVHDFVSHSRFAKHTAIHSGAVEIPFSGFDLRFDGGGPANQMGKAVRIASRIRNEGATLTVVHQHLPSAFVLSKLLHHPVLLHAHNFQKAMPPSINRWLRRWRYSGLAGIIFVSEECRSDFQRNWPDLKIPTFVVHNGLDLSRWTPAPQKRKRIFVVARAAPEKGVLEAAEAVQKTLPHLPGWTSLFVLSEVDRHPTYYAQIQRIAEASGGSITLLANQPHQRVKEIMEDSEIALVPSKWAEPFGRTAIEAHAGGAALISSGRGGLREVSADAALYVDPEDSDSLIATMQKLARDDALRRGLADLGRARVSKLFEIKNISSKLDDVYDRFL